MFYAIDCKLLNTETDAWLEDIEVATHLRRNGLGRKILKSNEIKVARDGVKRIIAACVGETGYEEKLVSWYVEQGYIPTRRHGYTFVTKIIK